MHAEKSRNTADSPLFRFETFIYFLTLVFRHEERERERERERDNFYYADCSYIAHSQRPSWTARPRVKSQLSDPANAPRIP